MLIATVRVSTAPKVLAGRGDLGRAAWPDQGVDVWRNKLQHIKALGGIAVLNIHPHWVNPDRPRHLAAVSQFLAEIAADENVAVTTPSTAARGGETAGVNRG